MKIAYCGYDFFAGVLEDLLKQGHEITSLFTFEADGYYNFTDRVEYLASEAGAPIVKSAIAEADILRLGESGCDLVLCAAYPYKVPALWSQHIQYGLNLHPSKLPEGRGPWPLPWVILNGLKSSAVTLHELSSKWDAGNIVAQREFEVGDRDDLEILSVKCEVAARELIATTLPNLHEFVSNSKAQTKGSKWASPTKEDRTLRWEESCAYNERIVRAFGKFEAHAYLDGKKHYVRDVSTWICDHSYEPGELVKDHGREYIVACSDGLICLRDFNLVKE